MKKNYEVFLRNIYVVYIMCTYLPNAMCEKTFAD